MGEKEGGKGERLSIDRLAQACYIEGVDNEEKKNVWTADKR